MNMRRISFVKGGGFPIALLLWLALCATPAGAAIPGLSGPTFTLTARADAITTPDGNTIPIWGFSSGSRAQYPGPTLIVNEGETVSVTLSSHITLNGAPLPVSLLFPGQEGVQASGGSDGPLTRESNGPDDPVTYTFVARHPGTYLYHSGTQPALQVEMGLVGALIVRPQTGAGHAYNHSDSRFDHEYLFLLTEMDPAIHTLASLGRLDSIDTAAYDPVYWFINGRAAPDTMAEAGAPWLPTQPYNAMVRIHPGERMLMRLIGAGRDLHPFHHHGNNSLVIARDGRLLQSTPGAGADLAFSDFTIKVVPGATYDALFSWTGKQLGWDIYGDRPHDCADNDGDGLDDSTAEYCADHGKLFPVQLPEQQYLTFGGYYSGSPYMGSEGGLPPGEGGLNPSGGYFYMWHSHTEKEMTNFDIFPGGMMTMLLIEPPDVPIP